MPSVTRRLARKYLPEEALELARKVRDRRGGVTPGRPAGARRKRPGGERDALLGALRTGQSLPSGLVAEVRARLRKGDLQAATAISASLGQDPATASVGSLTSGLVAFERGFLQLAWHHLAATPRDLWTRFAPGEYVRAGLSEDKDAMIREVEAVVDAPPAHMTATLWLDLLEPLYGAGEEALAARIFSFVDAVTDDPDAEPGQRLAVRKDWMQRWIARTGNAPTASKGTGDVTFAIMDYDHPGRSRASANIGDHVQTLASLGHLVRHQDLTYQGSQDLVDLVTQLRSRVRPDRRRTGRSATVDVVAVDRDATMYNEIPENTWTLAFGWYMHALFGIRYGFPFHQNLLPIFVSFHCNKRELLTPEAIEYLRRMGPIGCRDWTTVDILLSVDVPAFFSGCMTTTVNTVFPDLVGAFPAAAPVAYVDVPDDQLPEGAVTYKHSSDKVRFRSFTANMYEAIDLLETYRRDHSALVTSRLHCYLPMRSIGARVDFQPKNRSDIRFAGLIDINDDEFDAIRDGINAKLELVFEEILSGAAPEEVYGLWRRLTEPEVEKAKARRAAQSEPPHTTDLAGEVERALAGRQTANERVARADGVVDVVVPMPRNRPRVLNVLLDSLVCASSRPLHVHLLTKSGPEVDLGDLSRRFPDTAFTVVGTAGLGADLRPVTGRTSAVSGIETLLLPRLLPDAARAVVVPLPALVRGDVAELADLDLGGNLLAAPDVAGGTASGFGIIHGAGNRLAKRTTVSTELRRQAHARHAFDFTAFDTDVLVLDLAAMRTDELIGRAPGLVEEFGLNGREVLHFVVGPHRAVVPPQWHLVPTRSYVDEPALVHWADSAKPWGEDYVPLQELWFAARDAFRSRTRAPQAV